jgi:hypothetical protein
MWLLAHRSAPSWLCRLTPGISFALRDDNRFRTPPPDAACLRVVQEPSCRMTSTEGVGLNELLGRRWRLKPVTQCAAR